MKRMMGADTKETYVRGSIDRIPWLFGLFVVASIGILYRLYLVQIRDGDRYAALAHEQRLTEISVVADRGEIYLHDGEGKYPLAVNKEYLTAYLVPRDIDDPESIAAALSLALDVPREKILEKCEDRTDPYEPVKRRLSDEEAERVRALDLDGVGLRPEKYRYYPGGELASHVVGFASLGVGGGAGGYGIEASQDAELKGETQTSTEERDAGGRKILLGGQSDGEGARAGRDIVLTIDRVVQHEVEQLLVESLEKYGAERASAIVLEPSTGKILSMASVPRFDPNAYSRVEDYSLFLNPTVSLAYEPGSVMKPITMAIGVDEGKVSPSTEFVDTGSITESGHTVRNSEDKVYGRSNMMKVLEESINTGVIFVERLVGHQVFRDRLKRFGFGEKSGVELPAELGGNLRTLNDVRVGINFYTASFGQGITATPLQLALAYGALANGGVLMHPQIIERSLLPDGSEEEVTPREVRRVISRETAATIGTMLRSVVVNGHGKRADVPGYLVGGKTGTAQVAKSDSAGYEEHKNIGTFAGYAPINDPKYVVVIKVDNPKIEWAESSAAPIFGSIMKFLLEYAKIEPTETIR